MQPSTAITITHRDHLRLTALVASASERDRPLADALEAELTRANLVESEDVPPTIVTMNSRVVVEDARGARREWTLVYPGQANAAEGRVSVLAPFGAALLGLSAGQSIEWSVPEGRSQRLRVISVEWQPEAEGRYEL